MHRNFRAYLQDRNTELAVSWRPTAIFPSRSGRPGRLQRSAKEVTRQPVPESRHIYFILEFSLAAVSAKKKHYSKSSTFGRNSI